MSAVDEIQAAIDKLTDLKTGTVALPWELDNNFICSDGWILAQTMHTGNEATGQLIVTLHATIDAQLTILNAAHSDAVALGGMGLPLNGSTIVVLGLTLARAINGATA